MKLSNFSLMVFPVLLAGFSASAQEENRPNILIILADDQGNADAGYQRTPSIVSTPAIDAIAQDGIVFTNAYASAYVCAHTRAGLLTGRCQQRITARIIFNKNILLGEAKWEHQWVVVINFNLLQHKILMQ